MKVLVAAINYEPEQTGIAPYTAGLARGLLAAGHDVHVLTGIPHYPYWRNFTECRGLTRHEVIDGVPVTRVRHPIPRGGIGWRRVVMELVFGLRLLIASWGQPDVIVAVSPALLATGMALGKARVLRCRPKTVLWSQDLYARGLAELTEGGAPTATRLGMLLEAGIYRSADHVVAIGDSFRSVVVREFHVPPGRTSVHQNWSHVGQSVTASPEAVSQRLGWHGRRVALHAGNMGRKQGLDIVVAAAREAESRGSNLLLVLMGDGSERRALELAGAGCANLQFVDPLPDEEFRAALSAADVLMLTERPGVAEMAIPSKLTTYFQAGKPVVAAVGPNGNAARLVNRAGAGSVVAPQSPHDLIESLLAMVDNPAESHRCGVSGRQYAKEHLEAAATISGIVAQLEMVVSRPHGPTPVAPIRRVLPRLGSALVRSQGLRW